jgi:general secretion pathway protein D
MIYKISKFPVLCLLINAALFWLPVSSQAESKTSRRPLPSAGAATPAEPKQSDSAADNDSTAEINVKNADIAAIVRIFSRKTGRNYLLDERVKGKVTMYLPGKITPDESLKILDSVLALKGFTQVPISENMWKIVPSKEARQSTIPTVDGETADPSGSVVTKLITLKHVSAEEVQPVLQQLISADGLLSAYAPSNSLIIIDYENNIERIAKLLQDLDIPFSDREMVIIPIKNADSSDIADKLKELLGSDGSQKKGDSDSPLDLLRNRIRDASQSAASNANRQPGMNIPPNGQPVSQSTGSSPSEGARGHEPKIISDERTNSIIVVADEEMIARIRALVSELDSKVDLSGVRFYVYRCQHAKADELAEVLGGLVGGGSSGSGTSGSSGVLMMISATALQVADLSAARAG